MVSKNLCTPTSSTTSLKTASAKKIADICLDYGLKRIQYSVFLGDINTTRQRALEDKLTEQLGKAEGKIEVLTICAKDFDKRTVIEETGK